MNSLFIMDNLSKCSKLFDTYCAQMQIVRLPPSSALRNHSDSISKAKVLSNPSIKHNFSLSYHRKGKKWQHLSKYPKRKDQKNCSLSVFTSKGITLNRQPNYSATKISDQQNSKISPQINPLEVFQKTLTSFNTSFNLTSIHIHSRKIHCKTQLNAQSPKFTQSPILVNKSIELPTARKSLNIKQHKIALRKHRIKTEEDECKGWQTTTQLKWEDDQQL